MKCKFLISLLFLFQIAEAWEYELKNKISVLPGLAIELDDGSFVFVYTVSKHGVQPNPNSHLLHLSSEGELIDTIDFTNHFEGYRNTSSGIAIVNGDVIYAAYLEDSNSKIVAGMIKMNQDLEVIFDTVFVNLEQAAMQEIWPADFGFIVTGLTIDTNSNGFRTFWYFDLNFKLLHRYIDSIHVASSTNFLDGWPAFDAINKKIYLSVFFQGLYKSDQSNPLIYNKYTDSRILNEAKPLALKDGNVILPAQIPSTLSWPPKWDIILLSIDSNLQLRDSVTIVAYDVESRSASYSTLAEVGDDIYFGMTYNMSTADVFLSKVDTTSFMLFKYNSELDLIWSKTFRTDASYRMQNIMKTSNNGILMWGEKWDFNANPNKKETSMYILKVDSNGVSTGIESHSISKSKLIVYPNPVNDFLSIDLSQIKNSSEFELNIYDVRGNIVYNMSNAMLSVFNSKVDVSKLFRGVYFLRINDEDSFYSTSFIKN